MNQKINFNEYICGYILEHILGRSNSLIYCFCFFPFSILSEMGESETAHESTILIKQIMHFAKYYLFVSCVVALRMIKEERKKKVI